MSFELHYIAIFSARSKLEVKKEVVPAEVHFSADLEMQQDEKTSDKNAKRMILKTKSDAASEQVIS